MMRDAKSRLFFYFYGVRDRRCCWRVDAGPSASLHEEVEIRFSHAVDLIAILLDQRRFRHFRRALFAFRSSLRTLSAEIASTTEEKFVKLRAMTTNTHGSRENDAHFFAFEFPKQVFSQSAKPSWFAQPNRHFLIYGFAIEILRARREVIEFLKKNNSNGSHPLVKLNE